MKNIILVGIGGALGSMLRYLFTVIINIKPESFALATLLSNLLACLLLGIFVALQLKYNEFAATYLLLGTGFCGGLSTFSTLIAQIYFLFSLGKYQQAMLEVSISVVVGLFLFYVGTKLIGMIG